MSKSDDPDINAIVAAIAELIEVLRSLASSFRGADRLAYSVEDAGDVVGLSRSTLWTMLGDNRLQGRTVGSRTIILRSDLARCLEALPVRPSKPTPPEDPSEDPTRR